MPTAGRRQRLTATALVLLMIAAPISQFGNAMLTRGGELDERAPPTLTGEGGNSSGNNSGWTPYLNAWPTGGNGSMDNYEMNSTYANITIGAYELVNGTDYTVEWEAWDLSDWTMVAGSSWSWVAMSSMEEHYADVASIGAGCYDFVAILHDDDAGSEIENETWPFTIDKAMSECQNYTSGYNASTNVTGNITIAMNMYSFSDGDTISTQFQTDWEPQNASVHISGWLNDSNGDNVEVVTLQSPTYNWAEGYAYTTISYADDLSSGTYCWDALLEALEGSQYASVDHDQKCFTVSHSSSGEPPMIGIVSYESEDSSSSQSCSDYDDSGCPLSIGDLDEGWVNITLAAWNLGNESTVLEVSSWIDGQPSSSFTISVNGTESVEVTLPFWLDSYTCRVEIAAELEVGTYETSWSQSWTDMCDAPPSPVPELSSVDYYSYGNVFVFDLMTEPSPSAVEGIQWVLANATNLTVDEYYWVQVDAWVDGVHAYVDDHGWTVYDSNASFWPSGNWDVSEYDCYLEIQVALYNETDVLLDSTYHNLSAPCEPVPPPPVPELTAVDYYTFGNIWQADLLSAPGTDAVTEYQWVLANATNLTNQEWYTVDVDAWVDGNHVYSEGHTNLGSWDGNTTFYPSGGWEVDEYDCYLEIQVALYNETDVLLDSTYHNLSAPCEDPLVPEISFLGLESWDWESYDYLGGWDLTDGGAFNISASDEPDADNYLFGVQAVNSTDEWLEMSPTLNLTYVIAIDGVTVAEGYDEQYASDPFGWGIWFTTGEFTVSPYDCSVTLYADLLDSNGSVIDSVSASLDAPCEVPDETEISFLGLESWDWESYDYLGGWDLTDGGAFNISASDEPDADNYLFGVQAVNSTDEWLEMSPTLNLTYVIAIDGVTVAEGYDEQYASDPFGWGIWFTTGEFTVSLYDCSVTFDADLLDYNGNVIDSVSASLTAPCDMDSDGDGVGDADDDFPFDANETADSDGDGVGDNSDGFPEDANESSDADGDGVGDNEDSDDDGDGIDDDEDDSDGDGVMDDVDDFPYDETETTDSDGDGVGDNADDFPNDANETTDTDGDGTGDNSDEDSDGDGEPNDTDDFPLNSDKSSDADGDGVDDENDAFPNDAGEYIDSDGDGIGNNADADDDDDGSIDIIDDFPLDPAEDKDTDKDGLGDNADAFPNDASEYADADGDGIGNNADAFPYDGTETTDSDGDGVGDNADAFPNDKSEYTDSDGDGTGNNADAFPHDSTETADSDGDGVGDNAQANPPAESGGDGGLPGFSVAMGLASMLGAAILVAGRRKD